MAVASDTSLTVTSPSGTGLVDVIVVGPNASSAVNGSAKFTFNGAPTVTGLSANTGSTSGGTVVTVTGTGFVAPLTVKFGNVLGTNVTVNSPTSITVTSPSQAAGQVDVRIATANGTSAIVPADQFTYTAVAPVVSGLSPTTGSAGGGTTVTITGTGFTAATAVDFGGNAGTSVTVTSATSLTVITPAHAAGPVNVSVTGPGGTGSLPNAFTYTATPAVSSVAPNTGSTDGGDTVVITGTDFTGTTTVRFDNITATITGQTATTVTVVTPAHVAGVAVVSVTGPGGTSTVNGSFTYAAPTPTIGSISPVSGPITGGTLVTLTGAGFTGATAVSFGGSAGTAITVTSPTSLTVTTPAHALGLVDVTVTAPGGTDTLLNAFTYTPPVPTVGSVSPNAGTTSAEPRSRSPVPASPAPPG